MNGLVLSENWRKRRGHKIALWTNLETDGVVFEASYDEYWGVQSLKVAIEIEVGRCRNPSMPISIRRSCVGGARWLCSGESAFQRITSLSVFPVRSAG